MVTPIHLLLFGCRKVEWVDGVIRLDNWLVDTFISMLAAFRVLEREIRDLQTSPCTKNKLQCNEALQLSSSYRIEIRTSTMFYNYNVLYE